MTIPPAAGRAHLQFRRFASCPICHLHLHQFAQRHAEIEAADISEAVFFHSTVENLLGYQSQLPFSVIADPQRMHYRRFGVETGVRALTHPRAWLSAARGYAAALAGRDDPARTGVGFGDGTTHLGLPADFLIDTAGTVVAAHYGRHADDQWSVDQLLDINRSLDKEESP